MPHAEHPADQLLSDPDVERLVAFARSDNPLVALSIEKREIYWTQFMAVLLDPARRGHEDAIAAIQAMLDQAGGGRVERIEAVAAETKEGKEGRSDLAVECAVDGRPLTLIVENKIDTHEREDQLAGYVRHRSGKEDVRALLIELGDKPAENVSLKEAHRWDRQKTDAWLQDVVRRCSRPHPLAAAYRDLFEAWDLALQIRVHRLREIDAMGRVNKPPAEWRLVKEWLSVDETDFFKAVLQTSDVQGRLKRLGLTTSEGKSARSGTGLPKLTKPSWTLRPDLDAEEGVNVHFEIIERKQLRLDIEVDPYEGGLERKPKLMARYKPVLPLKRSVHEAVRAALREQTVVKAEFKGVRSPDRPGTNKAAGFPLAIDASSSPAEFAPELLRVVEPITPILDAVIRQLRQDLNLR